jgi:hypothetical protein
MIDVQAIFNYIADDCVAVYYGGSRVDPVIDHPHDYDYICFAKRFRAQRLRQKLAALKLTKAGSHRIHKKDKAVQIQTRTTGLNTSVTETNLDYDFSQIRGLPYDQITWFSYLDYLMIPIAGKDLNLKSIDIINEHRAEFIKCLKEKATDLTSGRMLNQKRWYHILRGIYILINNSYEVTPDQRREINILHDLAPGYEQIRDKTIELLKTL